jgi:uncharacterized protein
MKREEVLTTLKTHRDDLAQFGVKSLRLFGSTARDEMRPDSDVDLLVSFESTPSFANYMKLRIFLEDLLGVSIDLVTETGLRSRVRPYVERDAIRVA